MPLKAFDRISADMPYGHCAGVVSVSLHLKKIKQRKCKQNAPLVGFHLSKTLKTPLLLNSLGKTTETTLQTEMNGKDRRTNLKSTYTLHGDIRGKRLLLVDGMITIEVMVRQYSATPKLPGASTVEAFILALPMQRIKY